MDRCMGVGRIARTHPRKAYRQTRIHACRHAGGRACRHADTHLRNTRSIAGPVSMAHFAHARPDNNRWRPCRIYGIPRSGNTRTGAHLKRERVDRAAGTFGVEVDAAIDCVPEAPSRVAVEAQTAPVRLVHEAGRAHACRIVVERKKGRRADRAI